MNFRNAAWIALTGLFGLFSLIPLPAQLYDLKWALSGREGFPSPVTGTCQSLDLPL